MKDQNECKERLIAEYGQRRPMSSKQLWIYPIVVLKQYRALPTDPHTKEEILDMCSEHGENTSICSQRFVALNILLKNFYD